MRLAPEGKIIWGGAAILGVIGALVAVLLATTLSFWMAFCGWIPFVLTAFFFRDPERVPPDQAGALVAPADGRIIEVTPLEDTEEGEGAGHKLSIFMSPLDVHVNRIPVGGVIESLRYSPGLFLTAFHEKASERNEQQFIRIRSEEGIVECVQIAGWLARRIVCHLKEGQRVKTGERFGLIRFGSRLDVYLPSHCNVSVHLRERVRGGETVIGVFHEKN